MSTPLPLVVRGARTHNLDDVSLDLPRYKLITFCGVSGSGKTSMAIDTLYAEGQRRYIESFSPYVRQYLEQLDKPDADRIEGIPPTIAITERGRSRSNRTTVAVATEVADYLRLLLSRVGDIHCVDCDRKLVRYSWPSAAAQLASLAPGTRLLVGFEEPVPPAEELPTWRDDLVQLGFVRAVAGGRIIGIEEATSDRLAEISTVLVVVDRATAGPEAEGRLQESIETAASQSDGPVVVLSELAAPTTSEEGTCLSVDGREWQRREYRQDYYCDVCQLAAPPPEPRLLDFNSPLGACPRCEGFGSVSEVDMQLVIPDEGKSLREGAIAPWNTPSYRHELDELLALAPEYKLRTDVPWRELTDGERQLVIEGVREQQFGGLVGFFRWLEKRKYKMHLRVFISRWRTYRDCPTCGGTRLRPEALAIRLEGRHLADIYGLEVREALAWFMTLELESGGADVARRVLADILPRLRYLTDVGVGYLALDRSVRTLSSGESRRVAMTTTLGSNLVDMLYVLDEPSTGLHARDATRLLESLRQLRDRGNSVIVVEHQETILRGSDHVVEFGPQAGTQGGKIVYEGTPDRLAQVAGSPTGDWLAGRTLLGRSTERRTPKGARLTLVGARGHNLRNLTVDFPLGVLVGVTGVSGAGKSTLVADTLYPALWNRLNPGAEKRPLPLPHNELHGSGQLDEVVLVDQSPVAKSPRSNPLTYIKGFDALRSIFAELPEANARGLTASHFSFNVEGGRCEKCQGAGHIEVDMQFLADVTMTCSECQGNRYKPEVLAVTYRGMTIAEVLGMTAYDAFRFFRGHPKLQGTLKSLLDVGLEYLCLGQAANTLSGGEAQRLKLASYLAVKRRGRTLFILDEPSSGLHHRDIVRLVDCFDALIEVGHSVLMVEHRVSLLQAADWLIDLGPGAAADGGQVVAQGTPEELVQRAESITGEVLAKAFARVAETG